MDPYEYMLGILEAQRDGPVNNDPLRRAANLRRLFEQRQASWDAIDKLRPKFSIDDYIRELQKKATGLPPDLAAELLIDRTPITMQRLQTFIERRANSIDYGNKLRQKAQQLPTGASTLDNYLNYVDRSRGTTRYGN